MEMEDSLLLPELRFYWGFVDQGVCYLTGGVLTKCRLKVCHRVDHCGTPCLPSCRALVLGNSFVCSGWLYGRLCTNPCRSLRMAICEVHVTGEAIIPPPVWDGERWSPQRTGVNWAALYGLASSLSSSISGPTFTRATGTSSPHRLRWNI